MSHHARTHPELYERLEGPPAYSRGQCVAGNLLTSDQDARTAHRCILDMPHPDQDHVNELGEHF